MEIRWNNVIAAVLLLIAVLIFVNNPAAIGSFMAGMQQIGQGPDESIRGLIAVGFCGVVLVAVVRLLTSNGRNDR